MATPDLAVTHSVNVDSAVEEFADAAERTRVPALMAAAQRVVDASYGSMPEHSRDELRGGCRANCFGVRTSPPARSCWRVLVATELT